MLQNAIDQGLLDSTLAIYLVDGSPSSPPTDVPQHVMVLDSARLDDPTEPPSVEGLNFQSTYMNKARVKNHKKL